MHPRCYCFASKLTEATHSVVDSTVLYCNELFRIVSYRIVSHWIIVYGGVLRSIELSCIVLHLSYQKVVSIVLYRIVSYRIVYNRILCIVSYLIVLYRIVSYLIVLYIIVLYVSYLIVLYRIVSYRIVSYRCVYNRILCIVLGIFIQLFSLTECHLNVNK